MRPETCMVERPPTVDKRPPQSTPVAALITHEQARAAAMRLISSAFERDNGPKAKFSIPVQNTDDDVVILAYISQEETREKYRQ